MESGWFEGLEADHQEQLALLDRMEAAVDQQDPTAARTWLETLDRHLAEHLLHEEQVLRAAVERRMLAAELEALATIEREHLGLLGSITGLLHALQEPLADLQGLRAFIGAFRRHTWDERTVLREVHDRLATDRQSPASLSRAPGR